MQKELLDFDFGFETSYNDGDDVSLKSKKTSLSDSWKKFCSVLLQRNMHIRGQRTCDLQRNMPIPRQRICDIALQILLKMVHANTKRKTIWSCMHVSLLHA